MKLNPPLEKRKTDEIIEIAYGSSDEWRPEVIHLAKIELNNRKVNQHYVEEYVKELTKFQDYKETYTRRIYKKRSKISYSLWQLGLITIFAPFMLLIWFFPSGKSLSNLDGEGFNLMYNQKLLCYIIGVISWIYIVL